MESTGAAKAEAQSQAEAAQIRGEAAVNEAKLKAEAQRIEAVRSHCCFLFVMPGPEDTSCFSSWHFLSYHFLFEFNPPSVSDLWIISSKVLRMASCRLWALEEAPTLNVFLSCCLSGGGAPAVG